MNMILTKPAKRGLRTFQMLAILLVMIVSFTVAPQIVMAADLAVDVSAGNVTIVPGTNPGTIQVFHSGGSPDNLNPATTNIIITGSTDTNYVLVDTGMGLTCNITLNGVYIDATGNGFSPFSLDFATNANLTLSGANTLIGDTYEAGLEVTQYATLAIIGGTGSLVATGGEYAAGIGGGSGNSNGNIIIRSGTINATGGTGAAGIGSGNDATGGSIEISGSAFIESAIGGDALTTVTGGGAGIGSGGDTGIGFQAPMFITISSGVDLSRVIGGAADGTWTGGASVGTGGGDGVGPYSYALHEITYHNNGDPDIVQPLAYTINGGVSDAILPTLAHVQRHNPLFTGAFNGFWYDDPFSLMGFGFPVSTALTSTSIYDLYLFDGVEPKTGL